jgi:proteasome alpha subunit
VKPVSTPFYVSPAQVMQDRADYARKGIARGRSVAALSYSDGIVFVAENRSPTLHKVSEIYDRIGFAAAGKYNEFETLRTAGIRYADMRGYTYDRNDVTARGLSNFFSGALGTIFSSNAEKPFEVELFIAEVGDTPADDQIYRLTYEGSIVDEHGSAAMGGQAEQIGSYLEQRHEDGMALSAAVRLAVEALSRESNGSVRAVTADQLEVAVLDRSRSQKRKFKRILGPQLATLLGGSAESAGTDSDAGSADEASADTSGEDTGGDSPAES